MERLQSGSRRHAPPEVHGGGRFVLPRAQVGELVVDEAVAFARGVGLWRLIRGGSADRQSGHARIAIRPCSGVTISPCEHATAAGHSSHDSATSRRW
jgi:hypothetical protein